MFIKKLHIVIIMLSVMGHMYQLQKQSIDFLDILLRRNTFFAINRN